MTTEVETAQPAGQESAEQVQQVEQHTPEATAEHTQEQAAQTTEPTEPKKEPWFQKRINEQTRKYYEAERRAEQQAQEAQFYREQLARVQNGEQPVAKPIDHTSVEQAAQQLIADRDFNEACNKVYQEGAKEFPDFDNAVRNLQMVGINREFLELVATSDAGHKVLAHLGAEANLDEAERIARLPPVKMARELTKLEIKLSQPVPKPVSKAPAPITPIGSGGATDSGLRDDLSTDEWLARRNKQLRSR